MLATPQRIDSTEYLEDLLTRTSSSDSTTKHTVKLISGNAVLCKLLFHAFRTRNANSLTVVHGFHDIDNAHDSIIIYDESSASFASLFRNEKTRGLGERLIILTEKDPQLIRCREQAQVFSFPIDINAVCAYVEKTCA